MSSVNDQKQSRRIRKGEAERSKIEKWGTGDDENTVKSLHESRINTDESTSAELQTKSETQQVENYRFWKDRNPSTYLRNRCHREVTSWGDGVGLMSF